jgi:hypothetical protein
MAYTGYGTVNSGVVLNGIPTAILNVCPLFVRQPMGVALAGRGEGAFHGHLGVATISPVGR